MKRNDLATGIATIDGVLNAAECRALVARVESKLAADIWSRIIGVIPAFHSGRQVRGPNERFRLYRYQPAQSFKWHSAFRRDNGDTSLFTFMIYLNEGYGGGDTAFRATRVVGKTGMALMHEGSAVTHGVKYVLRSDLMYGPIGQGAG